MWRGLLGITDEVKQSEGTLAEQSEAHREKQKGTAKLAHKNALEHTSQTLLNRGQLKRYESLNC